MFGRKTLGRVVLGGLLGALMISWGATAAHADAYRTCQEKLGRAEGDLNHDIAHHGRFSWQVRRDYNRADAAQNWCSAHGMNGNGRGYDRDDRYRRNDRDADDRYYRPNDRDRNDGYNRY